MQLNGTIRIAVQRSGRLSEGSLALLHQMGLDFEAYDHHLFASCRNLPVDLLFLRDDDIPGLVSEDVCDLGIVGLNVVEEVRHKLLSEAGDPRFKPHPKAASSALASS